MIYASVSVIVMATVLLILSLQLGNCLLAAANTAVIAINIHILALRKLK